MHLDRCGIALVMGLFVGTGGRAQENARPSAEMAEAIALATKALERNPRDATSYYLRGSLYEVAGKYSQALADLDKALELDPRKAEAYQQRGVVHFKRGAFQESVRDFDKYLEMKPDQKVSHWQRGIALYYAGQYEKGRKQFEGYQEYDSSDVENALWRFLCMARVDGVAKAQQAMLKRGPDRRVPMREIYELYQGKLKPAEVLAAAEAGKPDNKTLRSQRFYAHLYLGLYYDLTNDRPRALEHLDLAADSYAIPHYMADVARIHRDLLRKTKSPSP